MKKQKGFTLIEMMVVVAIIGVLAGAVLMAVQNARKRSSATQAKMQANRMVSAIEEALLDGSSTIDIVGGGTAKVTTDNGEVFSEKEPGGTALNVGDSDASDATYEFTYTNFKDGVWTCTNDGGCRCANSSGDADNSKGCTHLQ